MPETVSFEPLPAKEAVDAFRKKGYQITFDWHEMQREEHAYNFTVAKVTQLDILQDIRQAVDKAISEGVTMRDFAANLKPTLQEKGWWGKKLMIDPNTGEEREVQLGSPRRLKTIYDTNLRTAHAAGRWERIQRTKKTRPYLAYRGIKDGRQREQHRQWNDIVLHADDPWWDEHYPPNGWHCRCGVQQLNERDLKRYGLTVTEYSPTGAPRTYIDKKTGNTFYAPAGVDPGFAYNVGKARMRAMTKPMIDRNMDLPFFGNPLPAPPAPRKLDASRILPIDKTDQEYVDTFLKEFGAKAGKAVPFTDVAGQTVIISDDIFKTAKGTLKIGRRDRKAHILLMADAIRDPDEIYHVWEEYPKGVMTLSRVYLSRWLTEDGKEIGGFTMMTISQAGWTGVTTFKADKIGYIDAHRRGALVYRRPE